VILAAKRGRNRALVPIKFNLELDLASLATDTVTTGVTTGNLDNDFDVISTDLLCNMRDQTVAQGPVQFGLAMSDYTGPEILECLDATPLGPYGPEMERSRRKVRIYGSFPSEEADESVNDGVAIRRKMFLRVAAGKAAADVWVVQRSGGNKTAGILEVQGVHWGRWR